MKLKYPFLLAVGLAIASTAQAQNFKIQVAAFADTVPMSYFTDRGVEGVTKTRNASGIHQYLLGSYATREQAEGIQALLVEKGFAYPVILDLEVERLLSDANCAYTTGFVAPTEEDGPNPMRYILFEQDKSILDAAARAKLDKIIEEMKADPQKELRIMGFTNNIGDAEENMSVASLRAKAARNYMINKGVKAVRLHLEVYGESESWYDNKDYDGKELPENQRLNNRVMMKYKK